MKLRNAQQGHAHLMLFVAVGFALIGFVGFNVYNKSNSASLSNAAAVASGSTGGVKAEVAMPKKGKKADIVKDTPAIRIIGRSDTDNKNVIGYIEVSVPGKSLERKHCSGSNTLKYNVNRSGVDYTKTVSLKYVKQKNLANGNGYCVVRLMADGKATGIGSWGVNTTFKGNRYLNAIPQNTAGIIENLQKDVALTIVGVNKNSKDAKSTLGYVEVKVPGMDLHKSRCAVKAHVSVTYAKTGKKLYEKDMNARYIKDKRYNNNQGYCVVRLPKGSAKTNSGSWTVTANTMHNDFLKPSPVVTTTFTN
jgi:hypothetical protein